MITKRRSQLCIVLIIFSGLLVFSNVNTSYAFFDFGGWEEKYNLLFIESQKLHEEIERLENENFQLNQTSIHWKNQTGYYYERLVESDAEFRNMVSSYDELVDDYNVLDRSYDRQIDDYNELVGDYNVLDRSYDRQIDDYDELVDDYNVLDRSYDRQIDDYDELVDDYNELADVYDEVYDEAFKPRTEIDKTKIKWTIQDSKGHRYGINWNFASYEDLKVYSDWKSLNLESTRLNLDGQTIRTTNLEGFVFGDEFACCIDDIYDNSESNTDFIWEVWYIVSQMTVYDEDVSASSDGRFALETLVRGGGDCEDLVILIAEMLKSSSHTKDWTIQYVYMDSENPHNPQTVNHVILFVDDGEYGYYIEATNEPNWNRYPDGG